AGCIAGRNGDRRRHSEEHRIIGAGLDLRLEDLPYAARTRSDLNVKTTRKVVGEIREGRRLRIDLRKTAVAPRADDRPAGGILRQEVLHVLGILVRVEASEQPVDALTDRT